MLSSPVDGQGRTCSGGSGRATEYAGGRTDGTDTAREGDIMTGEVPRE